MVNLRATKLEDIIGQKIAKERINVSIQSCKILNETLDHVLFYGPAGTGKTTFCRAIANELGKKIEIANGANLSSIKEIIPYVMRSNGNILFIDEIHRMSNKVAEWLFVVMEDFRADVGGDDVSIDLEPFTLMGATTNPGLILKPLRDRFQISVSLDEYTEQDLIDIVTLNSDKLDMIVIPEAKKIIASSSRGTPRLINNRLKLIRSYCLCNNINVIKEKHVLEGLKLEKVNKHGVTKDDIMYINVLRKHQPAGLDTLVSLTNLAKDTIQNVIEPFLLKNNVIKKTTKGRQLC